MGPTKSRQPHKRERLISFVLLAILLLTGIGSALSWRGIVGEMENHQKEDLEYRAEVLYEEIGRRFAILDGYAASFTREQLEDHEALLDKLERCMNNTEFSLVCFVYPDGTLYRQDDVTTQAAHRQYFQMAMQGEHAIEFVSDSKIDTESRVGMAVPVILDDEICGVLMGLYDRAGFRALFQRAFADSSAYAYICDAEGNLILGSETAEEFLDESVDEVEQTNLLAVLYHASVIRGNTAQVVEDLHHQRPGEVSYKLNGEKRHAAYLPLDVNDWVVVSVLHESQIYKEAMGVAGVLYAIVLLAMLVILAIFGYLLAHERSRAEQERRRNEEIRYMLEHDSLTDLLAEKAFLESVKARLHEIEPGTHCLIYLDIYKFKLINETFGYEKGDQLLCAVAKELKRFTEQYDGLCCRISGDVFALLLPHREEIIQEFYTRKRYEERIVPLDFYLHYGVYVIRRKDIPVHRMVDAAKLAQKTVKGNYTDCVAYFDDGIRERQLQEQAIITTMTEALENEEFVVYLQPQYRYRQGTICGAEALVRWLQPGQGMISPAEFIPVFETNGFITYLDEYVWEQVCRLQRGWLDAGKQIVPLSVNVSRADLLKGGIAGKLTELIKRYALQPEMIRVEITESAYIDDPQKMIAEIDALARSGFLVEMDDFGAGYSSLNMLKEVPFQVLKTDLKFLTASGIASRKDSILEHVIHMAHEMGMTVVAEGVETKEQADALLALSCECMQGYYFCKPIPAEEFEKLLS